MAITLKTFVDQITTDELGVVMVRYKKAIYNDGKLLSYEYHRTSIEPGTNPDEVMDQVDQHLIQMGHDKCDDVSKTSVRDIARVVHTPAKVSEFRQRRAKDKP